MSAEIKQFEIKWTAIQVMSHSAFNIASQLITTQKTEKLRTTYMKLLQFVYENSLTGPVEVCVYAANWPFRILQSTLHSASN